MKELGHPSGVNEFYAEQSMQWTFMWLEMVIPPPEETFPGLGVPASRAQWRVTYDWAMHPENAR